MLTPRSMYDPVADMRRLQSEVNRLFQSMDTQSTAAGFPPVNIYANPDGATVTAELPGVAENDVEVTVHRDTLTLRGERKDPADRESKGFHRRERGRGRFTRTLSLPFPVDPDAVDAHVANGMLHVSLRRPESDKPRRVQIRAS